ncbi:MAG: hypothetical protein U0790_06225 [Isosphaeraceae bacterium]
MPWASNCSAGEYWSTSDKPVAFGRWGFAGLCLYLGLLYVVTYVYLRPKGRLPPSSR